MICKEQENITLIFRNVSTNIFASTTTGNNCVDKLLRGFEFAITCFRIFTWINFVEWQVLRHANTEGKVLMHSALIDFQDQGEKSQNGIVAKIYSLWERLLLTLLKK